jgi:galactokinase
MTSLSQKLAISTPGRVCLFGEHQDYLHLPVIAAAISRRIRVEGTRRADNKVNIDLPDIRGWESFDIGDPIPYVRERDYFRSAINVLQRKGFRFPYGFECVVRGDIPINAGTSSSSALLVGWTNFLARMSEPSRVFSPEELAQYAYEAEVLEFTEPGGMMDHYSTAVGNLIWLESFPTVRISRFSAELKPFVLGNSHQPKDTKFILANVKNRVLEIVRNLKTAHSEFSLQTITSEGLEAYRRELDEGQFRLLQGTVANRDITFEAKKTLETAPLDHRRLGHLLNAHHVLLRDVQKISTPKIDRMIEAALNAGAYGAKINGSGGGGCMFAYAPENPEAVAEAVCRVSEASVVTVDAGSREDPTGVAP